MKKKNKLIRKKVSSQEDIIICTSHIDSNEIITLGNKEPNLIEYFNFQKIILRDIKKRYPELTEIHVDIKYWVIE